LLGDEVGGSDDIVMRAKRVLRNRLVETLEELSLHQLTTVDFKTMGAGAKRMARALKFIWGNHQSRGK